MQLRALARGMGQRRWWIGGAGVAALALVVVLGRFAGQASGQEAKAPAPQAGATSVKVARTEEGVVSQALSYSGEVRPVSSVTVLPKATGRIEALEVDVGSRVKKGDVIAELEASSLRAQVASAKANLAAATAKRSSLEAGARPEQVAQARASLDTARQKLSSMEEGSREEQVAQAGASLDSARHRLS